ncbi:hypothetical protein HN51_011791, partial [Arachis hypogaea]
MRKTENWTFWERNHVERAINALRKLRDESDVLVEKMDVFTIDLFACLLPVLSRLLDGKPE